MSCETPNAETCPSALTCPSGFGAQVAFARPVCELPATSSAARFDRVWPPIAENVPPARIVLLLSWASTATLEPVTFGFQVASAVPVFVPDAGCTAASFDRVWPPMELKVPPTYTNWLFAVRERTTPPVGAGFHVVFSVPVIGSTAASPLR